MENTIQTASSYMHLPGLITGDALQMLEQLINRSAFKDGKATATMAAKEVKNNWQIDMADQNTLPAIHRYIMQALNASKSFQAAAIPKQVYPPAHQPVRKRNGIRLARG